MFGEGKVLNDYGRGFSCTEHAELADLSKFAADLSPWHDSKFFTWFREAEDLENEEFRDKGELVPNGQLTAVRSSSTSTPSFMNRRTTSP